MALIAGFCPFKCFFRLVVFFAELVASGRLSVSFFDTALRFPFCWIVNKICSFCAEAITLLSLIHCQVQYYLESIVAVLLCSTHYLCFSCIPGFHWIDCSGLGLGSPVCRMWPLINEVKQLGAFSSSANQGGTTPPLWRLKRGEEWHPGGMDFHSVLVHDTLQASSKQTVYLRPPPVGCDGNTTPGWTC